LIHGTLQPIALRLFSSTLRPSRPLRLRLLLFELVGLRLLLFGLSELRLLRLLELLRLMLRLRLLELLRLRLRLRLRLFELLKLRLRLSLFELSRLSAARRVEQRTRGLPQGSRYQ